MILKRFDLSMPRVLEMREVLPLKWIRSATMICLDKQYLASLKTCIKSCGVLRSNVTSTVKDAMNLIIKYFKCKVNEG